MLALSRDQSREVDRLAMEELKIPGIVLMENAARGIAEVILAQPGGARGPVAIICGPGNNGGDGFAAARHLAIAGVEVALHLTVPAEAYREGSDPATNLAIVRAMGLPLSETLDFGSATLLVDAIFGTGLQREVRPPYRQAILAMGESGLPVVAVDVPSGLDADTGRVLGVAVRAEVTATMVAPKIGFTRGEGPAHAGRVEVVGIGIPPALIGRAAAQIPAGREG